MKDEVKAHARMRVTEGRLNLFVRFPRRLALVHRAVICGTLIFISTATYPSVCILARQTQRAREVKAIPAGEVSVILNGKIFNALLEAIFSLDQPLAYPLSRGGSSAGCASEIMLVRAAEGVTTAVHFRDGRIDAPLAFRGTYSAPLLGCLKFQGWADATLDLSFDGVKQALVARVRVRQVQLKNVPSVFADGVTASVQDAINARVNPIEILRAEQLSARLPLTKAGSNATLRLRAREVRHEIAPGELRLRIVYEFVREG